MISLQDIIVGGGLVGGGEVKFVVYFVFKLLTISFEELAHNKYMLILSSQTSCIKLSF